MEKVIVCYGPSHISQSDVKEVNGYLEKGWGVKSVTMREAEGWMTAIFVITKE